MNNLKKAEVRAKANKMPPKKIKRGTPKKPNKHTRHTTQRKNPFLSKMSHNLRTPLNAIIGFSEMICHGKAGAINKEQREYLNDILSSAKDLLQHIKKVAGLSKSPPIKKLKIKPLSKTKKRPS